MTMFAIIRFILDLTILHSGFKTELHKGLKKISELNKEMILEAPSICIGQVVRWDGMFRYLPNIVEWKCGYSGYHAYPLENHDLLNLVVEEYVKGWSCEIQEVTGLSASKSKLHAFESLDAMIKQNSQELIDPVTNEKLQENLAWEKIPRLLQPNNEFDDIDFIKFDWSNRLYLSNSGGSHHFAAARYLARKLGVKIKLYGILKKYKFNKEIIIRLDREYDIFIIPDIPASIFISEKLRDWQAEFIEGSIEIPCEINHISGRIILLKTNSYINSIISKTLENYNVLKLNQYLQKHCTDC